MRTIMSQLYLVGIHHFDPKGSKRLEKILNYIKPDHIAVEASEEDAMNVISKNRFDQMSGSPLIKIHNQYDILVSELYAKRNPGTGLSFLDDRLLIAAGDKEIKKRSNLQKYFRIILNLFNQKETDRYYDQDRIKELKKNHQLFEILITRRDENIEQKIREIYPSVRSNMAYIGGVGHFFDDYFNLHERLKDLNPVRIKLRDADKL